MTQSSLERQDPAERLRSLRVFYRDWRPTRLGRLVNRCWAWLSGRGLTPHILLTLQVKGRTTGRLHSTVLVPVTYKDQRYLVSMLGDSSEWVRNVRVAGGEAFVKRGQAHPVMLTEIPVEQRARILKAYCQVASSGRHHSRSRTPRRSPSSRLSPRSTPSFRIDAYE